MIHRAMIHTECFPQLFTEFGKVLASHCIMSFLVATFLGLVTKGIYNRYCHPLSKFPGPFWGSCTDLYLVFIIGSIPTYGYELHEKYGTISNEKKNISSPLTSFVILIFGISGRIVRLAPNLLSFSDPELLPVIYHRRADKTPLYSSWLFDNAISMFQTLPHDLHAQKKRGISPCVGT